MSGLRSRTEASDMISQLLQYKKEYQKKDSYFVRGAHAEAVPRVLDEGERNFVIPVKTGIHFSCHFCLAIRIVFVRL